MSINFKITALDESVVMYVGNLSALRESAIEHGIAQLDDNGYFPEFGTHADYVSLALIWLKDMFAHSPFFKTLHDMLKTLPAHTQVIITWY